MHTSLGTVGKCVRVRYLYTNNCSGDTLVAFSVYTLPVYLRRYSRLLDF